MKKSILKTAGLIVALFTMSHFSMAQTVIKQDLSIFPKPEAGYKKMVIDVPYSDKDNQKKIEFMVGKMMEVDGCNQFGLIGTLEEKDLAGWGYSYYIFQTKGDVVSTQMACPGQPTRHLFVSAQSEMVNYNGRLPIVIYVPEEYEVRFKIYKAEEEVFHASESPQGK